MAAATATLAALPNELILQVLGHLRDDAPSLQAAARTCSALKAPAEFCLYASIQATKRAPLGKIIKSINQDPARQQYIHHLGFLFSTRGYDHANVALPDLRRLNGLRSLISESPHCNAGSREPGRGQDWDHDMQSLLDVFHEASLLHQPSGPGRPLENLQSLTLHWTSGFALDERLWHTTPSCPVFLIPGLRSLTMSCAVITATDADKHALAYAHQTGLETLALLESIVSAEALDLLLALPRALRSLELYEMSHHSCPWSGESIFHDVDAFNRAISRQRRSLGSLSVTHQKPFHTRYMRKSSVALALAEFDALEDLQVGPFLKDAGRPWALVPPLPPALARVRLAGFDIVTLEPPGVEKVLLESMHLGELAANAMDRKAQLQVDLAFSQFRSYRFSSPRRPTVQDLINDFMKRLAEDLPRPSGHAGKSEGDVETDYSLLAGDTPRAAMRSHSTPSPKARVRFMTSKRVPYIPPYLYGERRPRPVVRFDSADSKSRPHTPYLAESGAPEDELESNEVDQDMREAFIWASG